MVKHLISILQCLPKMLQFPFFKQKKMWQNQLKRNHFYDLLQKIINKYHTLLLRKHKIDFSFRTKLKLT